VIQKILVVFLAILVSAAAVVGEVRKRWAQPLRIPEQGFSLLVSEGASLRSVAKTLKAAGVLDYSQLVTFYGQWTGVDQQIKPGEYHLAPGTTAALMLAFLQRGDTVKYQVTLPEGITLATALGILSQQEKLESVLTGPDDQQLLQLIEPWKQPEGLFFPDTYQYTRGDTDLDILQSAHRAMEEVLQDEWLKKAPNLPYAMPYDALIMASIIEKETGLPEERRQISGVFVRRLQKGMRLQTDPTVIYGLGLDFDGNLKREHLVEETNSYNTYRHAGLPPTPIALPGRAAINAALHPDDNTSLYFVARGDGSHVFSATLKAHSNAVREYQLNRKKANQSTKETSP
jgi:UPF0755 protein